MSDELFRNSLKRFYSIPINLNVKKLEDSLQNVEIMDKAIVRAGKSTF